MKVIKNKTIDFATAVQAPVINGNRAARTGYVRLVRLITDEPVPQQTSYTGKIELRQEWLYIQKNTNPSQRLFLQTSLSVQP